MIIFTNHYFYQVHAKCIGDGDGFTAYVDTADPGESTNVPQEVLEAVIAMARTPKLRKSQKKNVLQTKLNKAGYRYKYYLTLPAPLF
jgi:hypothetical protein